MFALVLISGVAYKYSLNFGICLPRIELLNLKISAIDGKRKLVHTKNAKGKKDSVVQLPKKLLVQLREYYQPYKPKEFLFAVPAESAIHPPACEVYLLMLKNAKIKKHITLHSLRCNSLDDCWYRCSNDSRIIRS